MDIRAQIVCATKRRPLRPDIGRYSRGIERPVIAEAARGGYATRNLTKERNSLFAYLTSLCRITAILCAATLEYAQDPVTFRTGGMSTSSRSSWKLNSRNVWDEHSILFSPVHYKLMEATLAAVRA